MEYHRRGTEIREIQILYSGKAHRRSVLEGARSRPGPEPHPAETPGRLAGINTEACWSYCRLRLPSFYEKYGLTPKELEKIFDRVAEEAHAGVKRVSAQQEKAAWLRRGSSAVEAVAGIGEMVIQEQAAAKLQAAARGGGQRKGAGKTK
jgi:hypothetical protein